MFIKIITARGSTVYINIVHIEKIVDTGSTCTIVLPGQNHTTVQETAESLIKRIEEL